MGLMYKAELNELFSSEGGGGFMPSDVGLYNRLHLLHEFHMSADKVTTALSVVNCPVEPHLHIW